jgi:hypothetical protein
VVLFSFFCVCAIYSFVSSHFYHVAFAISILILVFYSVLRRYIWQIATGVQNLERYGNVAAGGFIILKIFLIILGRTNVW